MAGLVDLTSFLSPLVSRLVDFIPDPLEKAKAQAAATSEMLAFVASQNTSQDATNTAEASNASLFVAGWRPFIGWIGGAGLGWSFVAQPIFGSVLAAAGSHAVLPTLDNGTLMVLVTGMLGLGGMRTFEKVQGVAPKGAK